LVGKFGALAQDEIELNGVAFGPIKTLRNFKELE
jgi:hypothetical protein